MRSLLLLMVVSLGWNWGTTPVWAQQNPPGWPVPRLELIMPVGGKVGSVVEVTLTGTDLDEPQMLLFSHPAIKAEYVPPPPPPAADPKKPKPPAGPPKFKVTIPPDAPLGTHDVRFVGKFGVSNPRTFAVGEFNELPEKEPNNDVGEAQKIEIPSTIDGVINNPADVDLFSITAKKGQRILALVQAYSIDSRAFPAVEIFSPQGKRLAFAKTRPAEDVLADFVAPNDGEYLIRVTEFTHMQGGPQIFYRLTVSTAPWIDAVFPPMLEPGKPAQVTLYGRNLPGGQLDPNARVDGQAVEKLTVTITPPNEPNAPTKLATLGRVDPKMLGMDGFDHRFKGPNGSSNAVRLYFASAPVVLEKEGNDTFEQAQDVPNPCEVAGRIDKRGDLDFYAFSAKKGETLMIEAFAERIGTPMDLFLAVRHPKTKQDLVEADDTNEPNMPQFYGRTADPTPIRFTAPEDGKYVVVVGSRESAVAFGPKFAYRLRLALEQPDFRLVAMPVSNNQPASTVLRPEGCEAFDLFVIRRDGFNGPIQLTAEGFPPGITAPPQFLPSNARGGPFVVQVAAGLAPTVLPHVSIKGTATINGQTVVREARPASIVWPVPGGQNIPAEVRMDRSRLWAIGEKAALRIELGPPELVIKPGEKSQVMVKVARLHPDAKVAVNLSQMLTIPQPPPLVQTNNNQPLAVPADKAEIALPISAQPNTPPGVYPVIVQGVASFPYDKDPAGKAKKPINVTAPAVPLLVTVVPAQLANVSVPTLPAVKIGATVEMVVKVARQHGYQGAYQLKCVLPPGTTGIRIAEATIPAGKEEVKIPVQADANAKPGPVANVAIQVTGLFDNKHPVMQEVKVNLNVVK